jgi:hypothetical protein
MLKNSLLLTKINTKISFCNFRQIIKYFLNQRWSSNLIKIESKHFFSENNKIGHKAKITQIYEYTNAEAKARSIFWVNIIYIYGNSILLHLDIFDPAMGYFHGMMLTLSVTLGWTFLFVIGNVIQKTIYKIYRVEESNSKTFYKIEFIPYFKKSSYEIISKTDVVDYTQSNIENFHFFRLKCKKYKKVYINTHKNLYEYDLDIQREFKNLVSTGLEN